MRPINTLFVILDGGRARFVKRGGPRGALATFHEFDGLKRLNELRVATRGRQKIRTFHGGAADSQAPANDDLRRHAKEAFVAEVAELAARIQQEQSFDSIFVVAPSRLLREFLDRLPSGAKVTGVLSRDLTKTPDAELSRWLHPVPTPVRSAANS